MELIGTVTSDRPLLVVAVHEEAEQMGGLGLPILVTGAGKVNATGATAALLADQRPSEVVNLGTAGALVDGCEGIHVVGGVIQHDFDNAALFELTGRSFSEPITFGDGLTLATGDVFLSDSELRAKLAERAQLVDMEGFGIALAARRVDVPVRLVKYVSDSADESAFKSWVESISYCAAALAAWAEGELT
ncbi:MAG: nucleosidase [Solirubrobacterales bacterium]|nr:nucleosidase [Solirubrobacterales bacterium]